MAAPTFANNGAHHASDTDADLDVLYAWMPPTTPALAPLPEAAFSLTLKGRLGGIDALLTIRGMTASEFQTNLRAIQGLLDAPIVPEPTVRPEDWCSKHGMQMKRHENARGVWYSHYFEGTHCKGK